MLEPKLKFVQSVSVAPMEPKFSLATEDGDNLATLREQVTILVQLKGKALEDQIKLDGKTFLVLIIAGGYKFNGASIPATFRPIFGDPFDYENLVPSLPHDYCYENRTKFKNPTLNLREFQDELFYYLLRSYGKQATKAALMFYAVRSGGQVVSALRASKRLDKKFSYFMWSVAAKLLGINDIQK